MDFREICLKFVLNLDENLTTATAAAPAADCVDKQAKSTGQTTTTNFPLSQEDMHLSLSPHAVSWHFCSVSFVYCFIC